MDANEPEASLVRPFLAHQMAAAPLAPPTAAGDDAAIVRSYAITSGRGEGSVHLEFESMLQLTTSGIPRLTLLTFERLAIAQLCRSEILSVAELSARLHVPIGVIRVVASDLIVEGYLEAFLPSFGVAEDVDLITRLIEGVRAL